MTPKSTKKYEPRSFGDLVFPSETVRRTIGDYKSGYTTDNLLLYGPPGTGKSSIARLIPGFVDANYSPADVVYINCGTRNEVKDLEALLRGPMTCGFFNGGRPYVILDEVDNLKPSAMAALKGYMDMGDRVNALFVLTTNNIDRLEPPVKDRCESLFVGHTRPEHWLNRARQIVQQEIGKNENDNTLLSVIETANGSGRETVRALLKYTSRLKQKRTVQPTPVASVAKRKTAQ